MRVLYSGSFFEAQLGNLKKNKPLNKEEKLSGPGLSDPKRVSGI